MSTIDLKVNFIGSTIESLIREFNGDKIRSFHMSRDEVHSTFGSEELLSIEISLIKTAKPEKKEEPKATEPDDEIPF